MEQSDVANWSDVAEDWITWVRTEDHDAFWAYRDAFERFVGPGTARGIEVGAGEGRICRVLQNLGYEMTAVEPVAAFLEAAKAAGSAQDYLQAPATNIPLPDARFDLVALYNVLMDVEDLESSVKEAARLLAPNGRMIVGIVHPIYAIYTTAKSARTLPNYFEPEAFDNTIETNGLKMRFCGWARPLANYITALTEAGLTLTRIEEPRPNSDHPAAQRLPESQNLPLFLWFELMKLPKALVAKTV